jgi:tetratricopeptide (TPR) repeat protein
LAATWNNKGNALDAQGSYTDAIQCFDEAIRLDQLSAASWRNKGLALNNLGKYNESIQAYDKAIELNP